MKRTQKKLQASASRPAGTAAFFRDAEGNSAAQISGRYQGAIIVLTCAACFTPLELFLVEIWPRHGFVSLLLIVVPLLGARLLRFLPERYYHIHPFEASGRIYEGFGIRFFKRLVPNGDYINRIIRRSEPGYRVVWDESSIRSFEAGTRWAERSHLGSLLLALPSTAYAVILGWEKFALWLFLSNLPFHLYPILLQRYNRVRIEKALQRRKRTR